MFESKVFLIAGIEIAMVLLVLSVLLLLYIRGLRRLVTALEAKVTVLRETVRSVRREAIAARRELAELHKAEPRDYGSHIDEQIGNTRERHLQLNSDREIYDDMAGDASPGRQALSLRHSFLLAEQEAWLATEGRDMDWGVLESRLGHIAQRLGEPVPTVQPVVVDTLKPDGGTAALLASQRRRIEDLEHFRQLYFDTELKWREASRQAEHYHRELSRKGLELGEDPEFAALLARYAGAWEGFGAVFDEETEPGREPEPADAERPATAVRSVLITGQDEIARLRTMAVDQHKMILMLRQQLNNARSAEEKDLVIEELRAQLERHERFLKESELCTQQLEDELERLIGENEALKQICDTAAADTDPAPEILRLRKLVDDFTRQSCDMVSAIETLEKDNARLHERLDLKVEDDEDGLRDRLAAAQEELSALQVKHVELEERYLALKVQLI